ncbi:MAG: MBL fold metallo-hydrolase [Clostridium sp.]|nr:MBL fold metallo-hydrolase [Clostridium sp.]MCM1548130.1 MBL fold metallo-hydrolase [Ruminococcus sp.]
MARSKKKTKISGGLFGFILIIAAGLAAAHFLGIFTIDDWKEILGTPDAANTEGTAQVHFIDVGQGDCELIISDGESMLIDTGEKENAENVCRYIRDQGLEKLDYMLLTHQHSDHMGGASEIINGIEVENIIIPKLPDDMTPTTKFYEDFLISVKENGLKLTPANPGDTYEIGECSLEIISPVKDYNDLNNFSAAAILTHGNDDFLFTGDIEKKAEKDILETGRMRDIDVLKTAHHGSSTSSCKEFLDAARPDYAVISCGEGNSYNHPNKAAVERIGKYTDSIYRTDIDGTIVFESYGDGLKIETEKGK